MSEQPTNKKFAVCVKNSDYPASLELLKIYEILPDDTAEKDHLLRVMDESGEDYLYPADCFLPVNLPQNIIFAITNG